MARHVGRDQRRSRFGCQAIREGRMQAGKRDVPSVHSTAGANALAGGRLMFRLFLPLSLGYFLSYFFRTINAVIVPQLTADFGLTAASVGLLTSVYFLSFAGMQIPIGLMVDRFGPRRVQSALLLVAAIGALGFAFGRTLPELIVARGLIGAGVAGSLMVSFTAFVLWLPPARVSGTVGLLMAFGGMGAFAAGAPTAHFIAGGGAWRDLFFALAVGALAISAVVFIVLPERPRSRAEPLGVLLSGLRQVFVDGVFWRVAPLTVAVLGSGFAIQGLWAGPWLMQVAHRDASDVGIHLSAMAVALILGAIACGPILSVAQRFGFSLLQAVGAMSLVFIAAMAGLVLQLTDLSMLLLVLIAFLINPISMSYVSLTTRFDTTMAARVTTAINAMVLVGSFLLQWIIGAIIGHWMPIAQGIYPAVAYQAGFGFVLCCLVISWCWYVVSLARSSRFPLKPKAGS